MILSPRDIQQHFSTEWKLPFSKSVSNRLAVIQRLAGEQAQEFGPDQPDDMHRMANLLHSESDIIDVQHAGTAARFGMAYLALTTQKRIVLNGSPSLQSRPMGELIAALRKLGADVVEIGKPGALPVQIQPAALVGGSISMDGRVSSQFVSALCLIGPHLHQGLSIQLVNGVSSRPYLDMTLEIMRRCGAEVKQPSPHRIEIKNGRYRVDHSLWELDFSAAHYAWAWSQLIQKPILLPNLSMDSLQGDSRFQIAQPMWATVNGGLQTVVHSSKDFPPTIDFESNPDLAPTYICMYAALGLQGRFTGLHTLNQKESRRLDVLASQLKKAGFDISSNGRDQLELHGGKYHPHSFPTFDDHRMAMSFALFGAMDRVEIENPEVVSKSFPKYWEVFSY